MELNHLWSAVPNDWLQEGKGVQYPFEDKRVIASIEAIERTTKHRS